MEPFLVMEWILFDRVQACPKSLIGGNRHPIVFVQQEKIFPRHPLFVQEPLFTSGFLSGKNFMQRSKAAAAYCCFIFHHQTLTNAIEKAVEESYVIEVVVMGYPHPLIFQRLNTRQNVLPVDSSSYIDAADISNGHNFYTN